MKRIYKNIIFLVILLLGVSFQTIFAASSKPPMTCIDSPVNNSVVSKSLNISGWALDASGIKQVNIFADNHLLGTATAGLSRPDVDIVYPGYTGGVQSGYSYLLDINTLARGVRSIKVQSIGNDGTINEAIVNVNVVKATPLMVIDAPIQNQDISGNTLITGWALNASGINKVDVYIDGQFRSTATIGINRPDVNRVYPGYLGGSSSGFNYNLDINSISSGNHQIKVRATGNDGDITESQVTINKLASLLYIDSPVSNDTINNSVQIAGWALNAGGIKQINILVDNKQIGTTITGLDRTDVIRACPDYIGAGKSGYSYLLDINIIGRGTHTIKVQTVGNDGSIKEATTNVNVVKAVPMMTIDSPIQNQKIYASTAITGWALNASGIKQVDMYIDGQFKSTAIVGLSRPDVDRVYPGYKGGSTSGFNYNLDINSFGSGNHQIKVRATGNDGDITESQVTINKSEPLVCIDYPRSQDIIKNTVQISGWALNVTGVKQVNIYLDNTNNLVGSATIGGSRPDVKNAYPNYINAANSGYSYNMNTSSLVRGNHSIIVQAVGNDNEIKQSIVSISKGKNIFISTKYNISIDEFISKEMLNTPAAYIGGQWRYAVIKNGQLGYSLDNGTWVNSLVDYNNIKSQLTYNINPLNLENDPTKIYEFASLNYTDCVTAATLNAMFSANGSLKGKGQVFIDAAKASNVNPVYLASHSILETGNGTSILANGGTKNSSGNYTYGMPVYNLFGIGAVDTNVNPGGTKTAYDNGWTSVDLAIYGGAAWISRGYIGASQNTLYLMKWNPLNIYHQYATDVNWAASQTNAIKNCFDLFPDNTITFNIPVFN